MLNVKKGSFQIPDNISPDFQDLLKNIITWDSEKRFNMTQIINHTFFTGNKFSFCVPSNNNNTQQPKPTQNIPIIVHNSEIFNMTKATPLISTPELVKTTERSHVDLKPRKIFQNAENSKSDRESKLSDNTTNMNKNCKNISSSVGSKAFLKNFDYPQQNIPFKNYKLGYATKENFFGKANPKENFIGANIKSNNNNNNKLDKSMEKINKSTKQIKNELDQYLKTEVDATPKTKKSSKVIILYFLTNEKLIFFNRISVQMHQH